MANSKIDPSLRAASPKAPRTVVSRVRANGTVSERFVLAAQGPNFKFRAVSRPGETAVVTSKVGDKVLATTRVHAGERLVLDKNGLPLAAKGKAAPVAAKPAKAVAAKPVEPGKRRSKSGESDGSGGDSDSKRRGKGRTPRPVKPVGVLDLARQEPPSIGVRPLEIDPGASRRAFGRQPRLFPTRRVRVG